MTSEFELSDIIEDQSTDIDVDIDFIYDRMKKANARIKA